MPGGNQITFSYINLEVYSIEMIQPKKKDTKETYAIEIAKKVENMTNLSQAVYFDIKKRMNKLIEFIDHEKAQYISED